MRTQKPEPQDVWNRLVRFRDNCTHNDLKAHADMLLDQLNTASGARVKPEAENFLAEYALYATPDQAPK